MIMAQVVNIEQDTGLDLLDHGVSRKNLRLHHRG